MAGFKPSAFLPDSHEDNSHPDSDNSHSADDKRQEGKPGIRFSRFGFFRDIRNGWIV
jgi:hypothetical protein